MAIEDALARIEDKQEEQLVRQKQIDIQLEMVLAEARKTNGRIGVLEQWRIAHDMEEARRAGMKAAREAISKRTWALLGVLATAGASVAAALGSALVKVWLG